MQISFECEKCGHFHKVDQTKIGRRGRCRNCGSEVRVPVPGPIQEPSAAEVPDAGPPLQNPVRQTSDSYEEHGETVTVHVEAHLGAVRQVWRELISDAVPIDVLQVEPSDERPFRTLVTSGMSDTVMSVPPDAADYGRAELFLCLPPDWPIGRSEFQNERHYWPVRLLKELARIPQQHETWVGPGHSIGNYDGDQFTPYSDNTQFCCALVLPPMICAPPEFHELVLSDRTIRFYGVWPLYQAEAELKIDEGFEALLDRLETSRVTELVDISRMNACTKPRWKFW
ncbi:MAG: suppressor of fused domain protein [Planctomycetaceae bacterium]